MQKQSKNTSSTRSQIRWGVAAIVVLFLATVAVAAPGPVNKGITAFNDKTKLGVPTIPEKNYKLGLDLQGGVQLTYEAKLGDIEPSKQKDAVEGARDVIERRVNGLGVGETTVQTSQVEGKYRVSVELPGVSDVNQAIALIGETPILEFKEQDPNAKAELTADQKTKMTEYNDAAKARATALLDRLNKKEEWNTLATESEDKSSKDKNGDLGFIGSFQPLTPIYNWAKANKEGAVANTLIETPEGYNLVKRGGERQGAPQVDTSHLLICYLGAKECTSTMTKDEARAKIETLAKQATVKNFFELAKNNSTDTGTKNFGGGLGFVAQGQMTAAFDKALFEAKDGTIVGPVETEYGFHLIFRKSSKQETEYQVSRILIATASEQDMLGSLAGWKSTGLSGKQLQRAEVVTDSQSGAVQVSLQFNSEGAELFRDITKRNLNKPVAIMLDGVPISTPNVNTVIPDGRAVISGSFNLVEAKTLAQRLNAGALPVGVDLISQQTISAPLGQESLAKSLFAGMVAAAIVMSFMVIIYRAPGVVSVFALGLYISLTLALYKLFNITISLAGIAGFIMSLGVAVDANVLIFERLKEELKGGRSLRLAMEEGFIRAWTSIRDGNLSTLITCVILMWFGSSFVKGFAITLSLGIVVSLFTAITVTRTIMRLIAPWFAKNEGGWLFFNSKKS